ncbi:YcdB/YcdC domain-containing protein [Brevibacillus porteri]|uniref:YcdB/YcdC repeated domain-containing protein n=1 Tax=Brevibacillus porteri TaxID=2126350 RepID=A0ABX5FJS6_9BACL|nr:YcdB/YcdC domain-containing protein [Brevibacillus porteri]MED1801391.1 PepSY domain-containing protein [Brevibacillus porteri]MED2132779.1 PepSY domain-containing protein [Brevibacillus porteri]MED2747762.1 PepSY domain-containing protein [Brevibacillus porteri]MED2817542.1 PepSY domain-containing protein [Brevibacillus porteri]MED2895484.1 PepSY domain-containing protein [Brevibacillus porteri]
MKFPSDEEVLQEFRNRPDAVPRSEFLHTLERKLVEVEQQHRSRSKMRRTTIRLGLSAAVLLAVFFLAPIFTRLITHPESIMTTKPEAPLVLKGQQLKLAEVSPAVKQTLEKLFNLVPELKTMEPKVIGKEDGVYEIVFYQKEQGKEQRYVSVEMVAATGKISNYENEKAMNEEAPSPTEEEAKQMSAAFLQALLGDEFKQYQVSQNANNDWSSVAYTRYENGLPVFLDRYYVGVNSKGVTYVNTPEGAQPPVSSEAFPKPGTFLSEEEVIAKVASLIELTYSLEKDTGKPLLTYSLETTGYFHAETGEDVESVSSHTSRYSDVISVKPGGKKLAARDADEVAKVMAEEFGIDMNGVSFEADERILPDKKGVEGTLYKSSGGTEKIMVYTNNKELTGFQIRGKIETASSTQHDNKPANAKLTYEEAKEKAVQFLEPYLDSSVKELKIDESQIMMPTSTAYSFSFFALHDGVVVTDQNYLVNVDGQTGQIVNFMDNFMKPIGPFPDLDTAISREEAVKQFLQSHPVELGYILPVEKETLQLRPLPVYSVDTRAYFLLDAISGKLVK